MSIGWLVLRAQWLLRQHDNYFEVDNPPRMAVAVSLCSDDRSAGADQMRGLVGWDCSDTNSGAAAMVEIGRAGGGVLRTPPR